MRQAIKLLIPSMMGLILSGAALSDDVIVSDSGGLRTVVLDVQNMDCSLCQITLRKALEKVPGVVSSSVDFENHSAAVTFDPKVTKVGDLTEATAQAGYPSSIETSRYGD